MKALFVQRFRSRQINRSVAFCREMVRFVLEMEILLHLTNRFPIPLGGADGQCEAGYVKERRSHNFFVSEE